MGTSNLPRKHQNSPINSGRWALSARSRHGTNMIELTLNMKVKVTLAQLLKLVIVLITLLV